MPVRQVANATGDGSIARRVKARRSDLDWTAEILAAVAGVSLATVNGIEQGKVPNPGAMTLKKIAKALGCGLDDLVPEVETEVLPLPGQRRLRSVMTADDGERLRGRDSNPQPTD